MMMMMMVMVMWSRVHCSLFVGYLGHHDCALLGEDVCEHLWTHVVSRFVHSLRRLSKGTD